MRKHGWDILFVILLAALTLYVVLDTFVIERVLTAEGGEPSGLPLGASPSGSQPGRDAAGSGQAPGTDRSSGQISGQDPEQPSQTPGNDTEQPSQTPGNDNEHPSSQTEAQTFPSGPVITDDEYRDGSIRVVISRDREYGTNIYVADVTLSDLSYLKTAFARNTYGRNITATTSDMAASCGAVLAVNGDYYGSRERGFVLRNGRVYRTSGTAGQEDLAIMSDGSFLIVDEGKTTCEALAAAGALQVLSFGPGLIEDGAISVGLRDEVAKAAASNPRTAVGIIEPLHYVFVVSDGRTTGNAGLSLYELADFMLRLGVRTAYNLDGGGSSTLYFNGRVLNTTSSGGYKVSERKVSDIVYIG